MLYSVISSLMQQLNTIEFEWCNISIAISTGVLILVGIYILKFIFAIWQNRYFLNFCYTVNYKVTTKIIESYYNQSSESYKNNSLADALNKVFTIGGFFSEIIFQAVLVLFSEVILTLILIISLFIFNYKLLIILMVMLLPISMTLLFFSRKRLKEMSEKIMKENVDYHQSVMTMLIGLLDIKLSGRYAHFFANYKTKIETLHTTRKIINLENSFPPKVLELTAVLGIAALFFIAQWIGNDLILAGLLAAFATAAFRFIPSVNRIISSIHSFQLYAEYIQFMAKIKESPPVDKIEEANLIDQIETISLKRVSFSFGEMPVLNNVSLTISKGQVLGISGPSGVGKTTLVNIISGLLIPKEGELFINQIKSTAALRKAIMLKSAYVMQDPYFLNGSVADNIVFGFDKIPDLERIEWCLQAVNLFGWVNNQPKRMNAEVGEQGKKLSGGQKQRLAIARALYRKTNVLILDEPSNALDEHNKQEILQVIKHLTKQNNLVTILVSHDGEVLSACDSVFELQLQS